MTPIDAIYTEALAKDLDHVLNGQYLEAIFSTDKQSLFIVFDKICLKIEFYKGIFYLQLIDHQYLPKKNRIFHLKDLSATKVIKVISEIDDRVFRIVLDHQDSLIFRLFGKFSQISSSNSDWYFPLSTKKPDPVNSTVASSTFLSYSVEDLLSVSWLGIQDKEFLSALDKADKEEPWSRLKAFRCSAPWYVNSAPPDLNSYEGEEAHDSFLEAFTSFSRKALKYYKKEENRHSLIKQVSANVEKLKKTKLSLDNQLKAIKDSVDYRRKADLIMANLHRIEAGKNEITLPSFEGDGSVVVKLKKELNPQQNAERLYKKAKNEKKREAYVLSSIQEVELKLKLALEELDELHTADDSRELSKKYQVKKKSKVVRLPYRTHIYNNLEIRIGKSSKDNDELLRNFSSPNDLWFHAHAVSGSHVIVKLSKNQKLSEHEIEGIASLAAYHSKARSEEYVRVVYTYRKFVKKPKGSAFGAVKLEKETTVLVTPMSSLTDW